MTNNEKYIVQSMYLLNNNSAEEIAKHLNKPVKTVENYLVKVAEQFGKVLENEVEVEEEPVQEVKSTPKKKRKNDGMIHKTFGKGNKGVTIMTETASQKGDEAKKKVRQPKANPAIFKIHE